MQEVIRNESSDMDIISGWKSWSVFKQSQDMDEMLKRPTDVTKELRDQLRRIGNDSRFSGDHKQRERDRLRTEAETVLESMRKDFIGRYGEARKLASNQLHNPRQAEPENKIPDDLILPSDRLTYRQASEQHDELMSALNGIKDLLSKQDMKSRAEGMDAQSMVNALENAIKSKNQTEVDFWREHGEALIVKTQDVQSLRQFKGFLDVDSENRLSPDQKKARSQLESLVKLSNKFDSAHRLARQVVRQM